MLLCPDYDNMHLLIERAPYYIAISVALWINEILRLFGIKLNKPVLPNLSFMCIVWALKSAVAGCRRPYFFNYLIMFVIFHNWKIEKKGLCIISTYLTKDINIAFTRLWCVNSWLLNTLHMSVSTTTKVNISFTRLWYVNSWLTNTVCLSPLLVDIQ